MRLYETHNHLPPLTTLFANVIYPVPYTGKHVKKHRMPESAPKTIIDAPWKPTADARATRAAKDKARRAALVDGVLALVPEDRMASTYEIADAAACSRTTTQGALRELLKSGKVQCKKRRIKTGVSQNFWQRV